MKYLIPNVLRGYECISLPIGKNHYTIYLQSFLKVCSPVNLQTSPFDISFNDDEMMLKSSEFFFDNCFGY